MRTLLCLLLCTLACHAQTPEDQILAVYKQMEKAEQTGDANTWISLWSRASAPDAESMRPYVRPRPDRHYTSSKVFVQGDEAVLLGQSGKEDFLSVRFVREDGRWKIRDQVGSNTPYHADSVYAIIPPAAGAFARAGSPPPTRPVTAGRCEQFTTSRSSTFASNRRRPSPRPAPRPRRRPADGR